MNIELTDVDKDQTTSHANVFKTGSIDLKEENPRTSSCRISTRLKSPTGMNLPLRYFNNDSREQTRTDVIKIDERNEKEPKKPLKHQL